MLHNIERMTSLVALSAASSLGMLAAQDPFSGGGFVVCAVLPVGSCI